MGCHSGIISPEFVPRGSRGKIWGVGVREWGSENKGNVDMRVERRGKKTLSCCTPALRMSGTNPKISSTERS